MKKLKRIFFFMLAVLAVGLAVPQDLAMPVAGANKSSYHPDSFWFYPWGKSVTHKGVDIFAKKGTPVHSATIGVVIFCGELGLGGKFVTVLGPKWRVHYYAHLNEVKTSNFALVTHASEIGTVGNSGNAAGKPPHLHYAIGTLVPYFWRMDNAPQGWKKVFYLNPIDYFND